MTGPKIQSRRKRLITEFFDAPSNKFAWGVQIFITLLIFISVGLTLVEIVNPAFFDQHLRVYGQIELFVVTIFTIEYVLRLWAAGSRRKFVMNFYNVIDLLAIVPFFLTVFNLSFLRTFRFARMIKTVRILRILKVMKYAYKEPTNAVVSMSRIVKENIVKNVVVIVGILFMVDPLYEFLSQVDLNLMGDVIFSTSIIALAAMFGFFAFSYDAVDPSKTTDRFLVHLITGLLLFPIGIMFLMLQQSLVIMLETTPTLLIITMWLVYGAVTLFDFWGVKQIEEKLKL